MEEGKDKGVGKERKKKGNKVGTIHTNLLSFQILSRRQHWEQTSHWLNLKGERKEETKKKKGEQIEIETKHYFKGKYGSPICLDKCVPLKVSLLDNV